MPGTYLLISNPPHGDVDPKLAAAEFGFTASEALMQVHFPAPQVWFADGDLPALKRRGGSLRQAGANVRIIKGSILSQIPAKDHLDSFAVGASELTGTHRSGALLRVPFEAHAVFVQCRLNDDRALEEMSKSASTSHDVFSAPGPTSASATADTLAHMADAEHQNDRHFTDAYFVIESRIHRATLGPRTVNTAAPTDESASDSDDHHEFVQRLSERFRKTDLDQRLVDVAPPKPSLVGGRGLPEILGDIDPALHDLDTVDILSRLALLSRL